MSQEGFRISRKLAFPTIDLLIKHYQEHSLGNHFSSIKTKLSKLPASSKIQALPHYPPVCLGPYTRTPPAS